MKSIFAILLTIFCISLTSTAANAESKMDYVPLEKNINVEYGIPKGDVIPHDLTAVDQNERQINLKKLSGENGIVLYFVRSADWCQYCIFQLAEISQRGSIIEDTGYNIVIISNDSAAKLARFSRKYNFPYPMIPDAKSEIIKAFGLFNTNYQPGTTYYGIAHPAIYIIGKDGLILDKIFDQDFKVRATVSDVRTKLDQIGDYIPVLTNETSPSKGTVPPETVEPQAGDTNQIDEENSIHTNKLNLPE